MLNQQNPSWRVFENPEMYVNWAAGAFRPSLGPARTPSSPPFPTNSALRAVEIGSHRVAEGSFRKPCAFDNPSCPVKAAACPRRRRRRRSASAARVLRDTDRALDYVNKSDNSYRLYLARLQFFIKVILREFFEQFACRLRDIDVLMLIRAGLKVINGALARSSRRRCETMIFEYFYTSNSINK